MYNSELYFPATGTVSVLFHYLLNVTSGFPSFSTASLEIWTGRASFFPLSSVTSSCQWRLGKADIKSPLSPWPTTLKALWPGEISDSLSRNLLYNGVMGVLYVGNNTEIDAATFRQVTTVYIRVRSGFNKVQIWFFFFKEATYPPSKPFWKHLYWKGNEPFKWSSEECNALLTPFLTIYNFIIWSHRSC